MNEQRLFEMTSQVIYKRSCSEKHCTFPTQNIVIIDVEMINILIQGELLSLYIQLCHAQGYLSTAF